MTPEELREQVRGMLPLDELILAAVETDGISGVLSTLAQQAGEYADFLEWQRKAGVEIESADIRRYKRFGERLNALSEEAKNTLYAERSLWTQP